MAYFCFNLIFAKSFGFYNFIIRVPVVGSSSVLNLKTSALKFEDGIVDRVKVTNRGL